MTNRFLAAALLCLVSSCGMMPALARGCVETGTVMAPICGMSTLDLFATSDGRTVKSVRVTIKRDRLVHRRRHIVAQLDAGPGPAIGLASTIARPARYIAGRLICAVNVGAALAERGIRGTGSALAHSYDRWGVRVAQPVPGAVAVTDRRGGGHVAIVSRVEGARVFVWNPSTRGRGWREVEYTGRHARYRVAG